MLKGIPSILSPELLKVLMEMGHGNEPFAEFEYVEQRILS